MSDITSPMPALSAAKRLCAISGWSLTPLKVHKLLYLANMAHLGLHGTPLVEGEFRATLLGPIHPDVDRLISCFGDEPVGNIFRTVADEADESCLRILDQMAKALGNAEPGRLVAATQRKGGSWERSIVSGNDSVIPNAFLKQEFEAITKEQTLAREGLAEDEEARSSAVAPV